MKKERLLLIYFVAAIFFATIVLAEVTIPEDLLSFYANDATQLTLSNNSLLLYSENDRAIFYYLYYNPLNVTLNLTVSMNCVSDGCPKPPLLIFDYMQNDTTDAFVKKAAGIFVMTNNSPLGEFEYELVVLDSKQNYIQKTPFLVTVISSNFWTQFWYNLINIFG